MPAFFDQFLGAEVEFPDSMDPTKQQSALSQLYRQRQQQQSYQNLGYLGQLIGGMGNQQRTIPRATVTPTAAFAMTPQALQSYMGQQQERLNQEAQMQWASQEKSAERQQQNAIEQARQQAQLKRDIQTEKFRGDQLKLQKMSYDNQQNERDLQRKMREDAAKAKQEADAAKAEREASQGELRSQPGVGNVNIVWDEDSQSWAYRPIQGLPAAQSLARSGSGGGGGSTGGGGGGGGSTGGGGGGEGGKSGSGVKGEMTINGITFVPMDRYQTMFKGSDGQEYSRDDIKALMRSSRAKDEQSIDNQVLDWELDYYEKNGVRPSSQEQAEYKAILMREGEPEPEASTQEQPPSGGGGGIIDKGKEIITGLSIAGPMQKLIKWGLGTGEGQQQNESQPAYTPPRKVKVNGVVGYLHSDGTFVPDDPNAY